MSLKIPAAKRRTFPAFPSTNSSANELLRYAHDYFAKHNIRLASNEIDYSLLNRHLETNSILAACEELNVALIAILPLGEGTLTGMNRVGGASYPTIIRGILAVGQLDLFHQDGTMPLIRRLFTKPYAAAQKA
jgi:hypothetical protein